MWCIGILYSGYNILEYYTALSLVAQRLKRLPPMRETWIWSLGWEDPLEKEMVTHSSILAWRIPWMEEPGRLQSTGLQRVGHNWATSLHFASLNTVDYYSAMKKKGILSFVTKWIILEDIILSGINQTPKDKQHFLKKYGILHEFACHPYAGAMLIFSVSFQF